MTMRLRKLIWAAGWPLRQLVVLPIRLYRVSLGKVVGGGCRFHPSCSAYAIDAIERTGVVRGLALSAWRLARCSPLSSGGVDLAPAGRTWRELHEAAPAPALGASGAELEADVVVAA
jgi:putative membrane protein insertion efficiency factor